MQEPVILAVLADDYMSWLVMMDLFTRLQLSPNRKASSFAIALSLGIGRLIQMRALMHGRIHK